MVVKVVAQRVNQVDRVIFGFVAYVSRKENCQQKNTKTKLCFNCNDFCCQFHALQDFSTIRGLLSLLVKRLQLLFKTQILVAITENDAAYIITCDNRK